MKSIYFFLLLTGTASLQSCYKKIYLACDFQRTQFVHKSDSLNQVLQVNDASGKKLNAQVAAAEQTLGQAIADKKQLQADSVQVMATLATEIDEIDGLMVSYFQKIGKIAQDNKPPCSNAANGWMREYIVGDPRVIAIVNTQNNFTTTPAYEMYDAFNTFSSQNYLAFKNNGNYAPPAFNAIRDATLDHAGAILSLGADIVNIVVSGGNDSAWAQTAKDLGTIIPGIAKESKCYGGSNANGWISVGVNGAAKSGLAKVNGYNLFDPTTKVGKCDLVLQKSFSQLLTLSTQGHNPWLLPSWQLQYSAIMQATGAALLAIK